MREEARDKVGLGSEIQRRVRRVGVDGCRSGWIAVWRLRRQLDYRLFSTFPDLIEALPDANMILVDVPIGLPWAGTPIRPCDTLARRQLGRPRMSSVFPVPCREAVRALGPAEAKQTNQGILGRSLSSQTLCICPKINEADTVLVADEYVRVRVREVHPEVCFWALADYRAMTHKKSKQQGQCERLEVLEPFEPGANAFLQHVLYETARTDLQADDVLDALVALVTAEAPRGHLANLAGEPAQDQEGLRMEMVYREP